MILYASMSSAEMKAIRYYIVSNKICCCFYDLDTGNKEDTIKSLSKKNPSGVVPFLEDSKVLVSGSVPVLLYLAETYANFALFGTTIEHRSKVESVLFWAHNSLGRSVYYDFVAPRIHEGHSIGEFEDISLIAHGKSEIIAHFDTLERNYLNNNNNDGFLVGDGLTLADIYTAIVLAPLESVLFDFTPWPSLCKWFEGIKGEMIKSTKRISKIASLSKVKPV